MAGAALLVGIATGGLYLSDAPAGSPQPPAASCQQVFAGRAGTLPSCRTVYPDDGTARKVVGTTMTGCAIGLFGGGLAGAVWGCLGGFASNIPWG